MEQTQKPLKELNDFLTYHNLKEIPLPNEPIPFHHAFVIYPFGSKTRLNTNEYLGIRANELNKIATLTLNSIKDKLVVLHPVTFKDKLQHRLHQYLRAIALSTLLGKLTEADCCQSDEFLITETELRDKFVNYDFILQNTKQLLANCCMDDYDFGNKNKKTFTGSTKDDLALLTKLAMDGAHYRYGANTEAVKRIK